jgi:phage antirepressor YoqD-like protein
MQVATMTDQVTMTSLELVQFINNQRDTGEPELLHKNFMQKVPSVLGEGCAKFLATYTHHQNLQTYSCYKFPKREACLMAMSYSYDLQAKVFDRMTELEQQQGPKLPKTFSEALRLAAEQAEQIEAQALQIERQKPAVEFVNRYAVADSGSKGFRETCKLLKADEHKFKAWLMSKKIMYRLSGKLTAHQNHIDAGRFEVMAGEANGHAFNSCKFTPKGVVWIAGEWAKHCLDH